ncbi:MAG TPA: hypothetical protein VJL10_10370 [Anaerolineales bacterium]|nr:hypothetical protein [Anaerolineales bacterium]
MADLPDGVDINVARIAVAWEIVRTTRQKWGNTEAENTRDDYVRNMTNDYLMVYKAIINDKPIEKAA